MLDEQVRGVMRRALLSVSKSTKVELKNLRIKMKLTDDLESAECVALDKTEVVGDVSWFKILGLAIAHKRSIVGGITSRLPEVAEQDDIDKAIINVRVYAIDANGTPSMHLFNGTKSLQAMDINEMI
jgi:hypothetical protein